MKQAEQDVAITALKGLLCVKEYLLVPHLG